MVTYIVTCWGFAHDGFCYHIALSNLFYATFVIKSSMKLGFSLRRLLQSTKIVDKDKISDAHGHSKNTSSRFSSPRPISQESSPTIPPLENLINCLDKSLAKPLMQIIYFLVSNTSIASPFYGYARIILIIYPLPNFATIYKF